MIRLKEASSKGDPSWYSPRKNKQGSGKQQQQLKSLNEFLGSPPVTPPSTKGGKHAVDKKAIVSKWQNLVKKGGSNGNRGGGGGSTTMNDLHSSWSTMETAELTSHSESPLSSASRKSLHNSYGKLRIPSDFMDACSNALLEDVDEEDSKHDGTTTTSTTNPSTASKKQSSDSISRGNDSSSCCSSEGSSSIHSMIMAGNGLSPTSLPTVKSNKKESSSSSSSSSTKNHSLQYSSDTIQVPTDLMMMTTTDGKHKVAVGRVGVTTVAAGGPCSATSKKSRSNGSSVSTSSSSFSSSTTKRKSDFRYPSMLTSIEVDENGYDDDDQDDDVEEEEDALFITTTKPIKDSSIVSNNNYRQHSSKIRSAFSSSISTLSDRSDNYNNNNAATNGTCHGYYRTIITESELVATCQKRRGTCIMHVYDYNMEYNDLSCAIDKQLERLSAPIYNNNRNHKCEFVRVHASLLTPQLAQKLGVVTTSSETSVASKSSSTTCITTPTILAIRNGIVEGQLSDLFPDIYTTVKQRNDGRRESEVDEFIRDGQFVEDFVLITGCTKSDSCNLRSLLNSFRFVSITERGGGIL